MFGALNTLIRMLLVPSTPKDDEVLMTNPDQEYTWTIPERCREFTIVLQDTGIAWRFANTTGEVATAGQGTPVAAGGKVVYDRGFYQGTIYLAHSDAGAQVARIHYTVAGL